MDSANTHRAWRYARHGPVDQVLQLQRLPAPAPGANDVLVHVRHASINPLDWKLVEGQFRLMLKSKPPCGVGTEFAGVVAALGSGVGGVRVGQRIVGRLIPNRQPPCALAEQVVLPADQVVPLPDGVDTALACTLPVAGVSALQMCRMARVQRGTRVLVHGAAGGVGHASVLWALQLGAQVTATGSGDSQAFLSTLGALHRFDYTQAPPTQWGGPFDAVIDCVARLGAGDLAALMPQGGHAVATLPRFPGVAFDPLLNPLRAIKRHTLMLKTSGDDVATLLRGAEQGTFAPRVTQRYAMTDALQALLASRGGHVRGKLVIDVQVPSAT
jgi:NADPH:quinone reductase-like Zn-dependent oxidoreductase